MKISIFLKIMKNHTDLLSFTYVDSLLSIKLEGLNDLAMVDYYNLVEHGGI